MKILVACEESGVVTEAFRRRGHEAWSCDIVPTSGNHPEWHIQDDVTNVLRVGRYDMIVAFPPCTYLSNAGANRLFTKIDGISYVRPERIKKGIKARLFFEMFLKADCQMVAIENPIPSSIYCLPKYSQVIQPYEFGHPYSKKTCLWLKGLPLLRPTRIVKPICSWVSGGSKKADGSPRENKGMTFRDSCTKSKTFTGIAEAMAEQWGGI